MKLFEYNLSFLFPFLYPHFYFLQPSSQPFNIKILFSLLFLSFFSGPAFSLLDPFYLWCVGRNKNKFYKNMAYLWVAVRYVRWQTKEKKKRLCNQITFERLSAPSPTLNIFNLNKILFIRIAIAGNNCDLKMYLALRNVALKLNEVNFFNIFRERRRVSCSVGSRTKEMIILQMASASGC